MKAKHIAAGTIAAVTIGFSVFSAHAVSGAGFGPGMKGGMHHGANSPHAGRAATAAGHQLMTPEERTALQEKMRTANTPEERQKIAEATRTEMHKRAQEKGITLPEHRGPRFGATPQAPATSEHAH